MMNKNVSILLIDDNDITREVLRVVLRGEGYNVVGEATDGGSGLEMALKLRPDIILLDVVMPKISGLEILPKMKDLVPEARILMVTANKDQETVSEAVKAGIHGFIVKPFNAQKIIDTVAGVVAKMGK
ncbi:response regulator [Undibacterium curvum]|jgi:two-component system chemotaxis response regulator CheY|uniref:Response regulator transcription factor n=1 Tax=Undibacterium curvum TaxID=2762294 RepID=A0ABR7A294_9BURK|nr:response regulator transcription factor [Undibacterium curvum]MBC3931039.1 response regulator transcription factor [Undibacterium curvum]